MKSSRTLFRGSIDPQTLSKWTATTLAPSQRGRPTTQESEPVFFTDQPSTSNPSSLASSSFEGADTMSDRIQRTLERLLRKFLSPAASAGTVGRKKHQQTEATPSESTAALRHALENDGFPIVLVDNSSTKWWQGGRRSFYRKKRDARFYFKHLQTTRPSTSDRGGDNVPQSNETIIAAAIAELASGRFSQSSSPSHHDRPPWWLPLLEGDLSPYIDWLMQKDGTQSTPVVVHQTLKHQGMGAPQPNDVPSSPPLQLMASSSTSAAKTSEKVDASFANSSGSIPTVDIPVDAVENKKEMLLEDNLEVWHKDEGRKVQIPTGVELLPPTLSAAAIQASIIAASQLSVEDEEPHKDISTPKIEATAAVFKENKVKKISTSFNRWHLLGLTSGEAYCSFAIDNHPAPMSLLQSDHKTLHKAMKLSNPISPEAAAATIAHYLSHRITLEEEVASTPRLTEAVGALVAASKHAFLRQRWMDALRLHNFAHATCVHATKYSDKETEKGEKLFVPKPLSTGLARRMTAHGSLRPLDDQSTILHVSVYASQLTANFSVLAAYCACCYGRLSVAGLQAVALAAHAETTRQRHSDALLSPFDRFVLSLARNVTVHDVTVPTVKNVDDNLPEWMLMGKDIICALQRSRQRYDLFATAAESERFLLQDAKMALDVWLKNFKLLSSSSASGAVQAAKSTEKENEETKISESLCAASREILIHLPASDGVFTILRDAITNLSREKNFTKWNKIQQSRWVIALGTNLALRNSKKVKQLGAHHNEIQLAENQNELKRITVNLLSLLLCAIEPLTSVSFEAAIEYGFSFPLQQLNRLSHHLSSRFQSAGIPLCRSLLLLQELLRSIERTLGNVVLGGGTPPKGIRPLRSLAAATDDATSIPINSPKEPQSLICRNLLHEIRKLCSQQQLKVLSEQQPVAFPLNENTIAVSASPDSLTPSGSNTTDRKEHPGGSFFEKRQVSEHDKDISEENVKKKFSPTITDHELFQQHLLFIKEQRSTNPPSTPITDLDSFIESVSVDFSKNDDIRSRAAKKFFASPSALADVLHCYCSRAQWEKAIEVVTKAPFSNLLTSHADVEATGAAALKVLWACSHSELQSDLVLNLWRECSDNNQIAPRWPLFVTNRVLGALTTGGQRRWREALEISNVVAQTSVGTNIRRVQKISMRGDDHPSQRGHYDDVSDNGQLNPIDLLLEELCVANRAKTAQHPGFFVSSRFQVAQEKSALKSQQRTSTPRDRFTDACLSLLSTSNRNPKTANTSAIGKIQSNIRQPHFSMQPPSAHRDVSEFLGRVLHAGFVGGRWELVLQSLHAMGSAGVAPNEKLHGKQVEKVLKKRRQLDKVSSAKALIRTLNAKYPAPKNY